MCADWRDYPEGFGTFVLFTVWFAVGTEEKNFAGACTLIIPVCCAHLSESRHYHYIS